MVHIYLNGKAVLSIPFLPPEPWKEWYQAKILKVWMKTFFKVLVVAHELADKLEILCLFYKL
jgi:hypothetical protein